jgi:hypothetical protein
MSPEFRGALFTTMAEAMAPLAGSVRLRDDTLVRRKLGDRRGKPRFDIVGELPGTLETVLRLSMADVSSGGVLVQSQVMLPPDSTHRLTLSAGDRDFSTPVRVRHVREVVTDSGERTFLLGLEFVALDPALLAHMPEWIDVASSGEVEEV